VTELSVFNLLDKLHTTSMGPDGIPFCFLKLAAPIISQPLSQLINLSLSSSICPKQWKNAVIHPIAKISSPKKPSDMRPISVVSILSRVTERLVIHSLRPAMTECAHLSNQFAYQPTCSTTAALIALFDHVTSLLESNSHVHVISFDYSKAFDTVSHTAVASSLDQFNLSSNTYNWVIDFLSDRSHHTAFKAEISDLTKITAGVVQGSVLGPSLFNMVSSTLQPISPANKYFKYADDGYLVVPASNSHSIPDELRHHAKWAKRQNLRLSASKTNELVLCCKRASPPTITPNLHRVTSLKILGVTVDEKLTLQEHISETVRKCTQSFFALRTFKSHGLPNSALMTVFISKVLSLLTYASPAWWGFAGKGSRDQLEGVVRKAIKFNYYSITKPTLCELVENLDRGLFICISNNKNHCLHYLLPPVRSTVHNLRKRGHNYRLQKKDDRNFISRCLYKYI